MIKSLLTKVVPYTVDRLESDLVEVISLGFQANDQRLDDRYIAGREDDISEPKAAMIDNYIP